MRRHPAAHHAGSSARARQAARSARRGGSMLTVAGGRYLKLQSSADAKRWSCGLLGDATGGPPLSSPAPASSATARRRLSTAGDQPVYKSHDTPAVPPGRLGICPPFRVVVQETLLRTPSVPWRRGAAAAGLLLLLLMCCCPAATRQPRWEPSHNRLHASGLGRAFHKTNRLLHLPLLLCLACFRVHPSFI